MSSLFRRRHLWQRPEGVALTVPGPLPPSQPLPPPTGFWHRTSRVRRKYWSIAMGLLALACIGIALIPLGSILYTAIEYGARVINWQFITGSYQAPCSLSVSGCQVPGVWADVQGSLLLIALSAIVAIPLGILAAIYLAEYGRGVFGRGVSFCMDVMSGVPSIVIGVFISIVFIEYDHNCDVGIVSGSVALSVIMLPIVTRTVEESLKFVPGSLREAGYALGIPKHKVVRRVVLRTSIGPIATGSLLAVARAGGETAPLILTALGSLYPVSQACGNSSLTGALPLFIYFNYGSAYSNDVAAAWGCALLLIAIMLSISVSARFLLHRRKMRYQNG